MTMPYQAPQPQDDAYIPSWAEHHLHQKIKRQEAPQADNTDRLREQIKSNFDIHDKKCGVRLTSDYGNCDCNKDELWAVIQQDRERVQLEALTKGRRIQAEAMLSRYEDHADMNVLLPAQVEAWRYEEAQLSQSIEKENI